MKQYIKTVIYGSILCILMLVASLLTWFYLQDKWLSNFCLGCFSSAIVVVVFALISYLIDKKGKKNEMVAFLIYFEAELDVLKIYKRKYKKHQIDDVVYEIYVWYDKLQKKFDEVKKNYYSFKHKTNKSINLLYDEFTKLYLSLIEFTEKDDEVSIYAWFLYLDEGLKIYETLKEVINLVSNKKTLETERIKHIKERYKKAIEEKSELAFPKEEAKKSD